MRPIGEPLEQLLERLGREVVLVGDDVVRAEVVQRFAGPTAVGKGGQQGPGQGEGLVLQSETPQRAQIEEPRFRLPRRLFEIGLHAVARRGVALEEVVAFGDAQVDDLSIVARHLRLQVLKRATGLAVAPGAEED